MTFLLRILGLESGADVQRLVRSAWEITQPIPPALLSGIVVLGLALAVLNFLPRISMRPGARVATFLLRLALLGVLLVILLRIEWHVELELGQKQDWMVLVDDSASMATEDADGRSRFTAALSDLVRIRQAAEGNVDFSARTFSGRPLGTEPGQGPTLFQDAVRRSALARAPARRLVFLTDGRDSERRDLSRLGEDLQARDIAVSVRLYGARVPPRDSAIHAEPERTVIRLGEELIIRGSAGGSGISSDQTVKFQENGKEVKQVTVAADTHWRFEIRHRPERKGKHIYTLELVGSDALPQNNTTTFAASVVEEKIHVLLIEGSPRFEFKLIKVPLEIDPLVNLVSLCHIPGGGVLVQGKPLHRNPDQGLISSQAELFKYDVIILRDVSRSYFREGGDTTESRLRHIVEFVTKRGGGLIVTGGQDVYRAGGYQESHLMEVLPFDLSDRIGPQDQFDGLFYASIPKPAYSHPILRLLPEPEANRERLNSLRQLDGSNNVGIFKPLAVPLMTRTVKVKDKSGKETEKEAPILAYMAVGEGKVVGLAVDTLWRWQLQADFEDPPLTMLLANMVRYLAPPPEKKPGAPDVSLSDGAPQVGQELVLSSDLKDPNFDPIRNAELQVTVTRPDGTVSRMYPRDLPEEPGHYEYRVLLDQAGPYTVTAKHDKFESTREFLAGAASGEFVDLSVDREGMERMVDAAGGEFIGDLDPWLRSAHMRPAPKPAIRDLEVWNSPLLLTLFILLVSLDCYIRKRQGLA